ncbi:helix-turn-helix domain-containing protein [Streptomyces sp. NPDC012888]|uniref:helix-turn-helix domain-containing protein n=1 Tax=Streptomyces sp. NPDC012888 TaxID=3364855 RepID=UPI003697D096
MSTQDTDQSSRELDPEDESGAVVTAIGRRLKVWREAAGLTFGQFAARMDYGPDLISKIERGQRIPRPEYLGKADEALEAKGKISAMKADVIKAR